MFLRKVNLLLLLLLVTTNFTFSETIPFGSGSFMNYGIKPDLSQSELNSDVTTFYEKWKGDENGIELITQAKVSGDGYLARYDNENLQKPMYIIKSDVEGEGPVEWTSDNPGDPLTIVSSSEATGYGMIVFALMAGYDQNAQKYFDGLMNTYLYNLSGMNIPGKKGRLHTMSWGLPDSLTNRDGTPYKRSTSATDGDLDIAYALLLASQQWNHPSEYSSTNLPYLEIAKPLIRDIKRYLIDPDTKRVYLGDWQCKDGKEPWFNKSVTRSSDWMISHLRAFYTVDNDSDRNIWLEAIDEIYRILPIVDVNEIGLVPDFVEDIEGVPSPVKLVRPTGNWIFDEALQEWIEEKKFLEDGQDDRYDNNACRVPWRMATDYVQNGGSAPRFYLDRLNSWSVSIPRRKIRVDWGSDNWASVEGTGFTWSLYPESVTSGYYLDGMSSHGVAEGWDEKNPWVDYHFSTPIGMAHVANSLDDSKEYLNAAWSATDKAFGGDNLAGAGYTNYFADSITLLNMLLVSGNWWSPFPLDTWTPGICYKAGDEVIHNGLVYLCLFDDVSLPGREPDNPVMWAVWECKQK